MQIRKEHQDNDNEFYQFMDNNLDFNNNIKM